MRIISKKSKKEQEAEWNCDDCRSRISSKKEEGEITRCQRGDFVTFICPVCNFKNHISIKVF